MEITISDTSIAGKILNQLSISIQNERATVREIIEARVREEVKMYNNKVDARYHGLVQPSENEQLLNGEKSNAKRIVDAEKQIYIALDAFQKNGFFVLVNDQQETELDQELLLSEKTLVQFIKLTPLVGG